MSYNTNYIVGVKIAQGSIVPVLDARNQSRNNTFFTTIADGQTSAYFDLFHRNNEHAQWLFIDNICLENIPPQKAGEPDLELQARLGGPGKLSLKVLVCGRKARYADLQVSLNQLAKRNTQTAEVASTVVHPEPKSGNVSAQGPSRSQRGWFFVLYGFLIVLSVFAAFKLGLFPTALALTEHHEQPMEAESPALDQQFISESDEEQPAERESTLEAILESETPVKIPVQRLKETTGKGIDILAPDRDEYLSESGPEEYSIIWGDTLWRIAERYYGSRELYIKLAESNGLSDPDYIIAGNTLRLLPEMHGMKRLEPGKEETTAPEY